jgi:hypothetical protein
MGFRAARAAGSAGAHRRRAAGSGAEEQRETER